MRINNPCTICGKPGIPGLIKGAGKCQDHWNEKVHGIPAPAPMKTFTTLGDFLDAFTWSDNQRHRLRVTADRDDLHSLVAIEAAGRLAAAAFQSKPATWPEGTIGVWVKAAPAPRSDSRTQQAVRLVQQEGITPHAAAARCNVHSSAVYRALRAAESRQVCPHCGQRVKGP